MKKAMLILAVFLFSSLPAQGQEGAEVKDQLLTGLDQLEELVNGMDLFIRNLQGEMAVGSQIIDDMASIQWAQASYIEKLREQAEERDKLDRAKSQYIILLQSRQKNYRIALLVGIPAGLAVGVAGGYILHSLIH